MNFGDKRAARTGAVLAPGGAPESVFPRRRRQAFMPRWMTEKRPKMGACRRSTTKIGGRANGGQARDKSRKAGPRVADSRSGVRELADGRWRCARGIGLRTPVNSTSAGQRAELGDGSGCAGPKTGPDPKRKKADPHGARLYRHCLPWAAAAMSLGVLPKSWADKATKNSGVQLRMFAESRAFCVAVLSVSRAWLWRMACVGRGRSAGRPGHADGEVAERRSSHWPVNARRR